jgi:hypothetical protein
MRPVGVSSFAIDPPHKGEGKERVCCYPLTAAKPGTAAKPALLA